MSNELYEVAFSGEILEGADLQQVKAKVAAIFKADDAKLAQLFSGKRVVIKKNIDQATANKYKTALQKAGAKCEIASLSPPSGAVSASVETSPTQVAAKAQATTQPVSPSPVTGQKVAAGSADIPAAPITDPLGISANDITDWSASVAPVGSPMQDEIKDVPEPQLDLEGLDIAPPGSDLGQLKKGDEPPPPDTSGLSIVE